MVLLKVIKSVVKIFTGCTLSADNIGPFYLELNAKIQKRSLSGDSFFYFAYNVLQCVFMQKIQPVLFSLFFNWCRFF